MNAARVKAQPVGPGFAPYVWAPGVDEVAVRQGVPRQAVLKFDQNTPPLPGVPQVPLAESMGRLEAYPDGTYRELREAAASYVGLSPENVVVGAGADDLILLAAQTFLGPGACAAIEPPTYALYRIATTLHGAEVVGRDDDADLHWICNPNNPTGTWVEPEEIVELARSRVDAIVVVDEAYVEYGARSCAPWVDELENLVVLRTLSKAFGFAALRVGYALAHPATAALLTERRAPAPIAGPAAVIAAAALRDPRLGDVEATIVERERLRGELVAAGYTCEPTATNFVYVPTDEPLAERLEAQGIVVRSFPGAIRITVRRPSENDVLLRALGAEPGPASGREATLVRTTTETSIRLTLSLDGAGRTRVETGIGFLDHLLTLCAFHAGFDLDLLAGGDLDGRPAPHGRGRPRRSRSCAVPGAGLPGGRCPLRLGRRSDGRGARDRRRRPRPTSTRGDRPRVRRRPGRRARGVARAPRAGALRDRGRLHRARASPRGRTTTTSRKRRTRPSARRCARRSPPGDAGIRSTKGMA